MPKKPTKKTDLITAEWPKKQTTSSVTRQARKVRCRKLFAEPDFWEETLDLVADGVPLKHICNGYDIPFKALYKRISEDKPLAEKYQLARKAGAESLAGSTHEVLVRLQTAMRDEDCNPNVARVYLDYIKWRTATLDPDNYSEKKQLQHQHSVSKDYVDQLRALSKPKVVNPVVDADDDDDEETLEEGIL
jgi:hypothetical protein